MKVKLIKDYKYIPEGSVLQNVKVSTKHYTGIWSSMAGSYKEKVPKEYCEIIEE